MKQYLIFALLIITLLGCSKEKYDSLPHGYYTVEYENWAWGHQHSGWIIDKEGNVKPFNNPEDWNRVDSLGNITENLLLDNLTKCTKRINSISKRGLYKNNKLIKGAAAGVMSERVNTANDAGGLTYCCCQYDEQKDAYKRIELKVEGDWSYHNESNDAKEIVAWMEKVK